LFAWRISTGKWRARRFRAIIEQNAEARRGGAGAQLCQRCVEGGPDRYGELSWSTVPPGAPTEAVKDSATAIETTAIEAATAHPVEAAAGSVT